MLHSLAKRIAVFLSDKTDEYPLEIYTYGFELLISSITETFILIVLGVILDAFLETIVFVISFSFIRFFVGGYHAKSYLKCAIVTVIVYLLVIISYELFKEVYFILQIGVIVFAFLFSFVFICIFAPIENANKKIENKKKTKQFSLCILVLEFVLVLLGLLANFSFLLVVLPTVISVDVLMILEIIRKRGDKVEQ